MGHVEQPPVGPGWPPVRLHLHRFNSHRRPIAVSWRSIRSRFKVAVIFWLVFLSPVALSVRLASGKEFVVDRNVVPVAQIDDELFLLTDPSGKLEIKDVISPSWQSRFERQNRPSPVLGFTPDAIWARLTLRSTLPTPVTLQVTMPYARLSI